MADIAQIQCINKSHRQNPHEHITHVGGILNGTRWRITQQEAIDFIESGKWRFYVSVSSKSVWVIVATHNGHKYLKTENDSTTSNNLLSLTECPI
jgi:NAD-dependent DNA ligase